MHAEMTICWTVYCVYHNFKLEQLRWHFLPAAEGFTKANIQFMTFKSLKWRCIFNKCPLTCIFCMYPKHNWCCECVPPWWSCLVQTGSLFPEFPWKIERGNTTEPKHTLTIYDQIIFHFNGKTFWMHFVYLMTTLVYPFQCSSLYFFMYSAYQTLIVDGKHLTTDNYVLHMNSNQDMWVEGMTPA